MPVYTRKDFDRLGEREKRESFTVTAMKNTSRSLGRVQKLKDLITETIDELDEDKAWEQYWRQAKQYLREDEQTTATKDGLFVSFRYARQSAYAFAMERHLDNGNFAAIRLETMDDPRVRPKHARWHGVTLPADHPIWKDVRLPWDFNCRCVKVPLTRQDMKGKRMTPDNKIPPIPPGF